MHDDDGERTFGTDLRIAIDALPVPAKRAGAPPRGRSHLRQGASILTASAIVLVVAVVAGVSVGQRRAAAPGAVAGERYGLIVQSGGASVRSEVDAPSITLLYAEPQHRGPGDLGFVGATSPDGRRLAYWIWGQGSAEGGGLSLVRLALYDPRGASRDLFEASMEQGTGVAWSSDGTGLVVSTTARIAATAGTGTTRARLRTIDLGTGRISDLGPIFIGPHDSGDDTSVVAVGSDPLLLRPLLWDRSADRVVAALSAGNPNYVDSIVTIDHGIARTYPVDGPFLADTIGVSADGHTLAGTRLRDFALVAWPIDDYAARTELVPVKGERYIEAWWRPRSDQLFVRHDNGLSSDLIRFDRLEVWRPGHDSPRTIDARGGALLFRFDGSAYYRSSNGSSVEVVDADTSRSGGLLDLHGRLAGSLLLPVPSETRSSHPEPLPSPTK